MPMLRVSQCPTKSTFPSRTNSWPLGWPIQDALLDGEAFSPTLVAPTGFARDYTLVAEGLSVIQVGAPSAAAPLEDPPEQSIAVLPVRVARPLG
jgi:hypothetical protein